MYRHVKRVADVVVSLLCLVMFTPLLLLIAAAIKLDSKGPTMFRQRRYGKNKVPFWCYKFRTMTIADSVGVATKDLKNADTYITRVGAILRRLGLDELPQLINVLKGDMSLIGPRPVVLAETKLINEREKYGANSVTPGIGGWAQSNGRDEIDYKTKARLDGEYAQNFGFGMDVSCLWRTAVAVFTSDGFKEGHAGDTVYKHKVTRSTKKYSIIRRVRNRFENSRGQNARVQKDRIKAETVI